MAALFKPSPAPQTSVRFVNAAQLPIRVRLDTGETKRVVNVSEGAQEFRGVTRKSEAAEASKSEGGEEYGHTSTGRNRQKQIHEADGSDGADSCSQLESVARVRDEQRAQDESEHDASMDAEQRDQTEARTSRTAGREEAAQHHGVSGSQGGSRHQGSSHHTDMADATSFGHGGSASSQGRDVATAQDSQSNASARTVEGEASVSGGVFGASARGMEHNSKESAQARMRHTEKERGGSESGFEEGSWQRRVAAGGSSQSGTSAHKSHAKNGGSSSAREHDQSSGTLHQNAAGQQHQRERGVRKSVSMAEHATDQDLKAASKASQHGRWADTSASEAYGHNKSEEQSRQRTLAEANKLEQQREVEEEKKVSWREEISHLGLNRELLKAEVLPGGELGPLIFNAQLSNTTAIMHVDVRVGNSYTQVATMPVPVGQSRCYIVTSASDNGHFCCADAPDENAPWVDRDGTDWRARNAIKLLCDMHGLRMAGAWLGDVLLKLPRCADDKLDLPPEGTQEAVVLDLAAKLSDGPSSRRTGSAFQAALVGATFAAQRQALQLAMRLERQQQDSPDWNLLLLPMLRVERLAQAYDSLKQAAVGAQRQLTVEAARQATAAKQAEAAAAAALLKGTATAVADLQVRLLEAEVRRAVKKLQLAKTARHEVEARLRHAEQERKAAEGWRQ